MQGGPCFLLFDEQFKGLMDFTTGRYCPNSVTTRANVGMFNACLNLFPFMWDRFWVFGDGVVGLRSLQESARWALQLL